MVASTPSGCGATAHHKRQKYDASGDGVGGSIVCKGDDSQGRCKGGRE